MDAHQSHFRDADRYCKILLSRLSHGHGCLKGFALVLLAVAVAVGGAIMSQNMEDCDWNKLLVFLNAPQSI